MHSTFSSHTDSTAARPVPCRTGPGGGQSLRRQSSALASGWKLISRTYRTRLSLLWVIFLLYFKFLFLFSNNSPSSPQSLHCVHQQHLHPTTSPSAPPAEDAAASAAAHPVLTFQGAAICPDGCPLLVSSSSQRRDNEALDSHDCKTAQKLT